ncbi:hypothetical protein, partial [Hydrocoleum sp. CS-953]|uniref:hypothetical protein n=1 Tax=Hydrocoleum sp. CS-953 TaxID=1671698 RepID=UPI001AEFF1BE
LPYSPTPLLPIDSTVSWKLKTNSQKSQAFNIRLLTVPLLLYNHHLNFLVSYATNYLSRQ